MVFVERKTHRESWKGEESVKERVVLPENKVVPFLEQTYTVEQAKQDLRAKVGHHRTTAPPAYRLVTFTLLINVAAPIRAACLRTEYTVPHLAPRIFVRIDDDKICYHYLGVHVSEHLWRRHDDTPRSGGVLENS